VFWLAAAACLTLIAIGAWTVAHALLSGPPVIVPGNGFSHSDAFGFAIAPDGRTVYVAQEDVVAIAASR
jgi:hypothetical protein